MVWKIIQVTSLTSDCRFHGGYWHSVTLACVTGLDSGAFSFPSTALKFALGVEWLLKLYLLFNIPVAMCGYGFSSSQNGLLWSPIPEGQSEVFTGIGVVE